MRPLPTKRTRRTKAGQPIWLANMIKRFQAQIECSACKCPAQAAHNLMNHFEQLRVLRGLDGR